MKGSTMSRLDVIETEKSLREQNEMLEKLTDLQSVHENIDTIQEEEIDLQEWLEIFAEDQVKLQGCR